MVSRALVAVECGRSVPYILRENPGRLGFWLLYSKEEIRPLFREIAHAALFFLLSPGFREQGKTESSSLRAFQLWALAAVLLYSLIATSASLLPLTSASASASLAHTHRVLRMQRSSPASEAKAADVRRLSIPVRFEIWTSSPRHRPCITSLTAKQANKN